MNNCTTNTYQMKRDIVNFSKKICKDSNQRQSKFVTDMIYGISRAKNILLSSIAEALDEPTKKAYVIDRLSDNLSLNLDEHIDNNYCDLVIDSLGSEPVFIVDDSDIVKPKGEKFEDLGIVRDASSKDKNYEKGYHHTEIIALTKNMRQPVSLFSKIHSSSSKEYISSNAITFEGIDKIVDMLDRRNLKGIFVNDRAYDNNEMFNYYFAKSQYFITRLKENRKVYWNHRWHKITTLRDSRKGKIKMNIMFQGESKECYISILRVQITAKKKWINLILVYGLGREPMMLASNIEVKGKEDVIKIVRCYIDRWRIEEYFKFKKQEYHFENFRVRSLKAINNLNKLLTYVIGLISMLGEKINEREFVHKIIKASNSLKGKVYLWSYQIARGIYNILKLAKTGIKQWQEIRKVKEYNGQLSLL